MARTCTVSMERVELKRNVRGTGQEENLRCKRLRGGKKVSENRWKMSTFCVSPSEVCAEMSLNSLIWGACLLVSLFLLGQRVVCRVFGIFDGHGGKMSALFVRDEIIEEVDSE